MCGRIEGGGSITFAAEPKELNHLRGFCIFIAVIPGSCFAKPGSIVCFILCSFQSKMSVDWEVYFDTIFEFGTPDLYLTLLNF